MSDEFSGGCLCGAVRYVSRSKPLVMGHCQCTACRKSSGSGHSSHAAVPMPAVAITGKVCNFNRPADSGNMVTRAFCPTCGAPVYSTNSAMPEMIFIRASSLDDPEIFKPQMVVYTGQAPSWDYVDPDLASFEANPQGGPQQIIDQTVE